MPQLEITTFPSQIFWLAVTFLMLYLMLWKVIIPKISFVIKKREAEIKNSIHIAEQIYEDTKIINDEFEKIKKETQEEARTIINNLKEITNKKIIENTELLKKNLEKKLKKSEKEIFKKKNKTLKNINKISLNISQEIIKKVLSNKSIKKKQLVTLIKKNVKEIY